MDSTSTSSGAAPAPAPSSTPFGNPTAFGPSESSGKGKTVALICTSVLACLGLAFGGFEFYQNLQLAKGPNSGSGSTSQGISTFSLEVTNPDGSVAGLETDQFTIENGVLSATYNDPTVSLIINPEGASAPKPSDYIYITEWGIKIQKPGDWRSLIQKYIYHNDYPHAVDTVEIIHNSSEPLSHALISLSDTQNPCSNDQNCTTVSVLNSEQLLDIYLPAVDSALVSEAFRDWITDPLNYSAI